jgi:glycerol-3-phosphate dehydrogenase
VFALPRSDGLVAIGITDVPGEPADEPQPDAAEEAELLDRASAALATPLTPGDVCGRYAGLRPLAEGDGETADLSRRHVIVDDPSGALVIVGGKLTTYRRMAQDVVDRLTGRPCRTHRLPLVGAASRAALRSVDAPEALVRRYGTEAPAVAALADGRPELLDEIVPGVCGADLLWAARHELALTPSDLVDRRVRAGLVPEWRAAALEAVERLELTTIDPWPTASSRSATSS